MSQGRSRLMGVRRVWVALSLLTFNTIVLLVAINLVISVTFTIWDTRQSHPVAPVHKRYPDVPLRTVYPKLTDNEINALLDETWSRTQGYEPFTQHREKTHKGQFVNIDANGYRISDPGDPWPPPPNEICVFFFGGSTAFGYGVADDQTISSHLEPRLSASLKRKVHLYNFGRGYYYSSQERVLFGQLLEGGFVPQAAIFLDGLNDFTLTSPAFTKQLEAFMNGGSNPDIVPNWLPMVRVARAIAARLATPRREQRKHDHVRQGDVDGLAASAQAAVNRYLLNKRMIESLAEEFGVATIFVWQPVPIYKYDLAASPFHTPEQASHSPWMRHGGAERTRLGYEHFAEIRRQRAPDARLLWLADIQETLAEPLYVDQVHYTAAMSRRIAEYVNDLISERGLLAHLQDST